MFWVNGFLLTCFSNTYPGMQCTFQLNVTPITAARALQTFRKETDDGDELSLHGAEVAALMNLVATDTLVEEAVALIPSLSRFPEGAMDEILDLIRSTMIRIVS